jgi:hypothetical protein
MNSETNDPKIPYEHPAVEGDESESSIPGPVTAQDPDPEVQTDSDSTDEEAGSAPAPLESPPKEAQPDVPMPVAHSHLAADAAVLAESRLHTRRSFVVAAVSVGAGYGLWRWTQTSFRPGTEMQPLPLRAAFNANAAIARTVFRNRGLAPTYPLSRAETLRVNGIDGLKRALIPATWRLQLVGSRFGVEHSRYTADVTAWEYGFRDPEDHADEGHDTKLAPKASAPQQVPSGGDTAEKMTPEPMLAVEKAKQLRAARDDRGQEEAGQSDSQLDPNTPGLLLTMEDILRLPRHELVTQFKCIEGWSQIVHWAGVRMADFLEAYPPALIDGAEPKYVYMETPNGDYYTGYDMDVCRHPQTLLVTEMMGRPLERLHGAPLRLHMPTKYGYKQIKSIGLIQYTNDKPDDYWTRLGYDWYAGL